MVNPDKHKIYQRKIEAILPEPDAAPLVCITLNREWVALLGGCLAWMQSGVAWRGTDEQIRNAKNQAQKMLVLLSGTCPMLKDIRIEGNELQKQVCGSEEWETVGEFPTPEPVEPEMRVHDGFIQWRGSPTGEWQDLIALEDLQGAPGTAGENAPIPVFEWDDYSLKIDADADGTFDVTSPSLRGATGTGEPGEDAPIPAFRFVTDGEQVAMQIDADANGSWDYTSPNLKGDDGVNADCGCIDVPSDPEDPRTNDHICAGVNGMVDWILDRMDNWISEQQAIINGVKTLADGVLAIVTFGAGEITPFDNVLATAYAATEALISSMSGQLHDSTYQENIKCDLYCLIKNGGTGNLTQEMIDTWLDGIPDYPFLVVSTGLADHIVELFPMQALFRRYGIYSVNTDGTCEGLCLDCADETFCQLFDFTEYSSLPEIFSPSGTEGNIGFLVSGQGWQSVPVFDGVADLHRTRLYLNIPSGVQITSVRVKTVWGTVTGAVAREIIDDDYTHLAFDDYGTTTAEDVTHSLDFTGDGTEMGFVVSNEYLPRPNSGLIGTGHKIVEIEICGEGINPWEL